MTHMTTQQGVTALQPDGGSVAGDRRL